MNNNYFVGQPAQLLQVLQQTLPAEVFTMLIQRMRDYSSQLAGENGETQEGPTMLKLKENDSDDLEWAPEAAPF